MPYRKKSKPITGRRRMITNRRLSARGLLNYKPQIYNYKQCVRGGRISVGFAGLDNLVQANANVQSQIVVSLNDCPQAATFTALYDQYRINKVVLKFIPMNNSFSATSNQTESALSLTSAHPGCLHTVIDTDGNPSSTLDGMSEYPSFKIYPVFSGKIVTMTAVPGIQMASQVAGGGSATNITKKKQWIDCNSSQVNHFVGGYLLNPYVNNLTYQSYQIYAYYYLSFRNVR